MTADLGTSPRSAGLAPGTRVADFAITAPLRRTAFADVYRARAASGEVTLYLFYPDLVRVPAVRDAVLAGARTSAALPDHKHRVRTLGGGMAGDVLWVATEELDGSTLRELLARKREAGAGGFGVRGAANLIIGVASGLGDAGVVHGALSTDSVVVNRAGRVRVDDLALGPGIAAAIAAKLITAGPHIAPEVVQNGATPASDVYGLGALLYEALLGRPLERGGPRPSEVVPGLTAQVDELIARACHRDPDRRFGSPEVFKELVADALGRGGAVEEEGSSPAVAIPGGGPGGPGRPSLAQSIAQPGAAPATADPALAAALADTTEKWLISKGRLDYGPFSLADVLAQIQKGDIVAGNVIVDKDTGARVHVEDHPLLGPLVDHARQERDMRRRAEAEDEHHEREKKRHVFLYSAIAFGVLLIGVGVFFVIRYARAEEKREIAGVDTLAEGSLAVKMPMPKPPPKRAPGGGGGGRRGGGGGGGGGNETLALDLSGDEDDSSATLDMQTVFNVYSKYGGKLGGCMQSTGERSASISMIIDGPSGRVSWVKINGEQSGGLYNCLNRVLRSMQFPKIDGPRTRAEFDISL